MDRLSEIYNELQEIRDREAMKLFRLSRKAMEHDCPLPFCVRIRSEAWALGGINPEKLLDPFITWEFAFKLEGQRSSSQRAEVVEDEY